MIRRFLKPSPVFTGRRDAKYSYSGGSISLPDLAIGLSATVDDEHRVAALVRHDGDAFDQHARTLFAERRLQSHEEAGNQCRRFRSGTPPAGESFRCPGRRPSRGSSASPRTDSPCP